MEPQLTLSSLRARVMFIGESVCNKLADGLRLGTKKAQGSSGSLRR